MSYLRMSVAYILLRCIVSFLVCISVVSQLYLLHLYISVQVPLSTLECLSDMTSSVHDPAAMGLDACLVELKFAQYQSV